MDSVTRFVFAWLVAMALASGYRMEIAAKSESAIAVAADIGYFHTRN